MLTISFPNIVPQAIDDWTTACLPYATETDPTIVPAKPDQEVPQKVPAPPPLRKPLPQEKPHTPPESDPCKQYPTCEV